MIVENANAENSRTIRVVKTTLEKVAEKYVSANAGVNRSLELLQELEKRLAMECAGVFTRNELSALLDVTNGQIVSRPFWGAQWAMAHILEDADKLDGLGERQGVDVDQLTEKINNMSPAAWMFFHEELYRFWNEVVYSQDVDAFIEKYEAT